MGCDIHMYGEVYKKYDWNIVEFKNEDDWRVNYIYTKGRNYNLFAALAGVRANSFNDAAKPVSKPKGINPNCSYFVWNAIRKQSSDGHSHSWLTLDELIKYDFTLWGSTCDDFRNEVIPKLREALKESSYPEDNKYARIVFWFDN